MIVSVIVSPNLPLSLFSFQLRLLLSHKGFSDFVDLFYNKRKYKETLYKAWYAFSIDPAATYDIRLHQDRGFLRSEL
jgi:hypothetical protein